MDLTTYEQVKFELAQLIRSGRFAPAEPEKDSNKRYDVEQPWRSLLTRLAEDRFTVVVGAFLFGWRHVIAHQPLNLSAIP